jgi:hypothetical protein
MAATLDLATGQPLPADAMQRILYIHPTVLVYEIPPASSIKGHKAASWTVDPSKHIFTARLRVVETATAVASTTGAAAEKITASIVLEDPQSGDLFAAAPYTSLATVEQALDSSRFFAVRVQGEGGRSAMIGIGFQERHDAFDFNVTLQQTRRSLGLEKAALTASGKNGQSVKEAPKRDFSLKEGQTITVNIGGLKKGKGSAQSSSSSKVSPGESFSLPPPPPAGVRLAPPPSATVAVMDTADDKKAEVAHASLESMGFDDGEFGEFQ